MATRLKIYGGLLVGCRNEKLLKFPETADEMEKLQEGLRKLAEAAGFGVVEVHLIDYGAGNGPLAVTGLKESSFVIGAWPEKGNCIDFFVHFCESDDANNDSKAVRTGELLFEFSRAESIELSPLTKNGPVLFLELP